MHAVPLALCRVCASARPYTAGGIGCVSPPAASAVPPIILVWHSFSESHTAPPRYEAGTSFSLTLASQTELHRDNR